MQRGVELVWADAPHEVPPSAFGAREGARGWFFPEMPEGAEPGASLRASGIRYEGLLESLAAIEEASRASAPGAESSRPSAAPAVGAPAGGFDAWVCFSQGAVLAHHLLQLGLAARGGRPLTEAGAAPLRQVSPPAASGAPPAAPLPAPSEVARRCAAVLPSSVVLVCGFPSRARCDWPAGEPLPFPAMIVKSPTDTTVAIELQEELEARFAPLQRASLSHTHGHAMVQRAADVDVLLNWLHKHRSDPV